MSLSGVLMRKGAAVTFTDSAPGTYDPETDTTTGSGATSVTGRAMRIEGDPDVYATLGLIQSENPTLLFKPDTAGQLPGLGSTVEFGGETLTVKDVAPAAMNGVATMARIRCAR